MKVFCLKLRYSRILVKKDAFRSEDSVDSVESVMCLHEGHCCVTLETTLSHPVRGVLDGRLTPRVKPVNKKSVSRQFPVLSFFTHLCCFWLKLLGS